MGWRVSANYERAQRDDERAWFATLSRAQKLKVMARRLAPIFFIIALVAVVIAVRLSRSGDI